MNSSFKDIFLWFASLDMPSLSSIWTWLITVPWWLALIALGVSWLLAKALLNTCWNAWRWYRFHLPGVKYRLKRARGVVTNALRVLRGESVKALPPKPVPKASVNTTNKRFPDVLVLPGGRIKPVTFWARKWLWANTRNNCPSFDDLPEVLDISGDVDDLLTEMTGTGFVVKDKRQPPTPSDSA